jgi:hypothetical protein
VRAIIYFLFACWSLAPAACAAEPTGKCALTIQLVDAETGAPLPGIVRIRDADGKEIPAPAELLNHGQGVEEPGPIHNWWILPKASAVTVPAAPLLISAVSGLETELTEKSIDLTGKTQAEIRLPLVRFFDAHRRGYRAGNTHLHLRKLSKPQAERYLREVPRADGLDVVFVTYLERVGADSEYTTNHYEPASLRKLSDRDVQFGFGEEHRHNFGAYDEGYGHVLLLGIARLIQPVSIGPGITRQSADAPPLQAGMDETRRLGGKVVWAHNRRGAEDIPNWITGRIDANNVLDGNEHGSYEDPYYRYLNVGIQAPLSAGTDWFIYDFSRAYAIDSGATTPGRWLDQLAAGKSYVTNGPLVEFTVDDSPLGSVLELDAPRAVAVSGRVIGRTDFKRIELVQNGRVVRSADSHHEGNHFVAEMKLSLPLEGPSWLALRTPERPQPTDEAANTFPQNELGGRIFAHTSPIYVRVANSDVFDPKTAAGLINEMKSDVKRIAAQAVFENDAQRQQVFQVYEEAIAKLTARLDRGKQTPRSVAE